MPFLNQPQHPKPDKAGLIRELVTRRVELDPSAVAMGFSSRNVNALSELELFGLPEATIVSIAETWISLVARGVDEFDIAFAIEAHRGSPEGASVPIALAPYIKYRITLEHSHGAPISEEHLDYAIGRAVRYFK